MKVEIKDLHIKHFRFRKGAATVAFKTGIGGIDYSVAFCSHKDNFSKKAGRDLAVKRLVDNNCTFSSWCPNLGNDIFCSILMDILSGINVPNKLRPGLEIELARRLAIKNARIITLSRY